MVYVCRPSRPSFRDDPYLMKVSGLGINTQDHACYSIGLLICSIIMHVPGTISVSVTVMPLNFALVLGSVHGIISSAPFWKDLVIAKLSFHTTAITIA